LCCSQIVHHHFGLNLSKDLLACFFLGVVWHGGPILWSLQPLDIMLLDLFLWEHVNDIVYKNRSVCHVKRACSGFVTLCNTVSAGNRTLYITFSYSVSRSISLFPFWNLQRIETRQ
jgi:hypothetical protein